MLAGHIKHPKTYQTFLTHPVWEKALGWLKENSSRGDGEYEIEGRDLFAIVQTIQTQPRESCIFEAHKNYIDLQYCISGGELIEWAPVETLTPKGEFLTDKDYGHYLAPEKAPASGGAPPKAVATSLLMTPGTFGIFFPHDSHMPKISDGTNNQTKKVVVKIKESLLLTTLSGR